MEKLLILLLLTCCSVDAQQGSHETGNPLPNVVDYDRVEVVRQLIKALYPDLIKQTTMWQMNGTLGPEKNHVTLSDVRIYPCKPGGPVPGGQAALPFSAPENHETAKPWCGAAPTPVYENFFTVILGLGTDRVRPIFRFATQGSFADGKLEQLRQKWTGKAYPTDAEAIRALREENPKYGPDDRINLLNVIPLKKIREITSCNLQPETAKFVVELEQNPQHLLPDLQWHLLGNAPPTTTLQAAKCWATFEPFGGRLTLFSD